MPTRLHVPVKSETNFVMNAGLIYSIGMANDGLFRLLVFSFQNILTTNVDSCNLNIRITDCVRKLGALEVRRNSLSHLDGSSAHLVNKMVNEVKKGLTSLKICIFYFGFLIWP